MTSADVVQSLGAEECGLSSAQAAEARAKFGRNALAEPEPTSAWALFFSQFKNILIWILIGASVVSGVLSDAVDALAILAILLLNALVGFYQEYSADRSIAALRRMTAPTAKVWRDGVLTTIASAEVVPGDVLELEAGDLVAADARLLSAASLGCIEAVLTGESEPVAKSVAALDDPALPIGDRANMVFMGASVAAGTGRAVVVATGMRTEMGRIASLVGAAATDEGTPLQRKLDRFGRVLLWATLGIVALLFSLGLLRNEPLVALFMTSVSLAVAALPESLPAVVTAALSLGVRRMSRRGALVRRLAAVETLGATNIICTDKTGTLTVGQMTVRAMFVAGETYDVTGEGYGPEGEARRKGVALNATGDRALRQMAEILVGCNNAHLERDQGNSGWRVIGDPTEGALLCAGLKAGADRDVLDRLCPKIHELPFDSDRRLHSIVRRRSDQAVRLLTNGAPEALLARCSRIFGAYGAREMTEADREKIGRQNALLADRGLRVLGSAFRDLGTWPREPLASSTMERDLVFVGLTGLYDPPRPEAEQAVAKCRAAGVRVVMITGDHPRTAIAIGKELGLLEGRSLTGAELDGLTDEALQGLVSRIVVYARVSAAHKLRIVRALQANHAIVAMTGDGVNDAPAIKGADIGVAMGRTGAEVTKQASDMIITDDNFATIVEAVEQGRGIYENIRKTLQYLLACNASELALMTICIVSGLPAPLLPIHLLWINLVTDGPPALCLAADHVGPEVMQRPPRDPREQLANEDFLWRMLATAALVSGVSFVAFLQGFQTGDVGLARSSAFAVMIFAQLLIALGARSPATPIWRVHPFSNPALVVVVALSVAIQFWIHQDAAFSHLLQVERLSYGDGLRLLGLSAAPFALLEFAKFASPAFLQNEPRLKRSGFALATALIVAAVVAAGWRSWPQRREAPTHFITRPIARGTMLQTIGASGIVGRNTATPVLAPVSGTLQFRDCEVGARVARDQLCATIVQAPRGSSSTRMRARLEAAQARLRRSEAKLERAEATLAFARASGGASSVKRALQVQAKASKNAERDRRVVAQLTVNARSGAAEAARAEIRAPLAGIVSSRRAQPRENVTAGASELFAVTDPSSVQIKTTAPEADLMKIEVGAPAEILLDEASPRPVDARVTEIDRRRNIVTLAVPSLEKALEAGTAVTARVEVARRDDTLVAPIDAIDYSQRRMASSAAGGPPPGGFHLWVLRDGRPVAAKAQLGLRDDAHVEIVAGDVRAGDQAIVGENN